MSVQTRISTRLNNKRASTRLKDKRAKVYLNANVVPSSGKIFDNTFDNTFE